jgi:uncharacterized caspase-like protein
MTGNYWAIAIGINQYQDQRLQPLMYAQWDAQAFIEFLQQQGRFESSQCRLVADLSPANAPEAIAPTRQHIEATLNQVCQQQLQADDFLWCFFSGYGLHIDGVDYLLPADANLDQMPATAIAVDKLFDLVAAAPTPNIVLVLDMNRSLGAISGQPVGTQAIDLANQKEIALFLSCKPDQTSHETITLRQGLFTAAMLEGLRYEGCVTLEQLAQYLSACVPTLSEHHWRPRQDPLAVIPAAMRYHLIFPGKAIAEPVLAPTTLPGQAEITAGRQPSVMPGSAQNVTPARPGAVPPGGARTISNLSNAPRQTVAGPTQGQESRNTLDETVSDTRFWKQLLTWGGLLAAFLLLGVIFSNWAELTGRRSPSDSNAPDSIETTAPDPATPGAPPAGEAGTEAEADGNAMGGSDGPGTASPDASTDEGMAAPGPDAGATPGGGGTTGQSPEGQSPEGQNPDTPASPEATTPTDGTGDDAAPTNGSGTVAASPTDTTAQPLSGAEAEAAIQSARTALDNQDFATALESLSQLPPNQRPENYDDLLRRAAEGVLVDARATVSRPRFPSRTNQASDLSAAIQTARRIQPGQPYYEDAQADIRNWGRMILDLARGRASQRNQGSVDVAARNYGSAIAAAQLVPADQPQVYETAQDSIAQWSENIVSLAESQASRGNLSSAIRIAQQLPGNTPASEQVQQSIAQWSQQILDRARSLANEGRWEAAIQTARSVPANTPAYDAAQEAIAGWEEDLYWSY